MHISCLATLAGCSPTKHFLLHRAVKWLRKLWRWWIWEHQEPDTAWEPRGNRGRLLCQHKEGARWTQQGGERPALRLLGRGRWKTGYLCSVYICILYVYGHIHLWGSWAQIQSPALCASAAWGSHRAPGEARLPLSRVSISANGNPQSRDQNEMQMQPLPGTHPAVITVRFTAAASGLGWGSSPRTIPFPLKQLGIDLIDWRICSSCWKSVFKHQPLPAYCRVTIFHQELPLSCCSRLERP